jgi:hypothetical protein
MLGSGRFGESGCRSEDPTPCPLPGTERGEWWPPTRGLRNSHPLSVPGRGRGWGPAGLAARSQHRTLSEFAVEESTAGARNEMIGRRQSRPGREPAPERRER